MQKDEGGKMKDERGTCAGNRQEQSKQALPYRLMVSARSGVASRHVSALPLSPPLLKQVEKPG
jgi:hypothetical protein